jgi:hypothetical protein
MTSEVVPGKILGPCPLSVLVAQVRGFKIPAKNLLTRPVGVCHTLRHEDSRNSPLLRGLTMEEDGLFEWAFVIVVFSTLAFVSFWG